MNPFKTIYVFRKNVEQSSSQFGREIEEKLNAAGLEGYVMIWADMPSDRIFYAIMLNTRPPQTINDEGADNAEAETSVEATPVSTEA